MIRLAFFLLALAAPQDDSFPELVRKLGDDAAEVRDSATADLAALGEAARGRLEGALREATNAEVQARLRSVLRRLDVAKRRKEFTGGKLIDDLGARLTLDYDKDGAKLTINLEIVNLGTLDKPLCELRYWNVFLPGNGSRTSSAEGEIKIRELNPPQGGLRSMSMSIGCGPAPVRIPLLLKPGESRTFKTTINVAALRAGEHEVTASGLKQIVGTSEDLVSDAVKFKIEK